MPTKSPGTVPFAAGGFDADAGEWGAGSTLLRKPLRVRRRGQLLRWIVIVAVALLVPVVPFLALSASFETGLIERFHQALTPAEFALGVVAVLAADVVLPVPSSAVGTLAGARLGIVAGTAAIWTGAMVGSLGSFALARWLGRAIVDRWLDVDDRQAMEELVAQQGVWVVALTRALPVLSEAAILLLGSMHLKWRAFLPAVALSNLGVALVYATLGALAYEHHQLPLALVASIILPLLAMMLARRWWRQ